MFRRGTKRVKRCSKILTTLLCRDVFWRSFSLCYSKLFRPFAPIIVGLCLGAAAMLMLLPYREDSCETYVARKDPQELVWLIPREVNSDDKLRHPPSDLGKTPAPVADAKKKPAAKPKKVYRPKYASTELGIKEKLFVGVLSSKETLSTLGVAVNRTLASHVTKIVFFVEESPTGSPPKGMTVITLPKGQTGQEAIRAIGHVSKKWPDTYDFYLLMTDATYMRGHRLMNFVETTSVGHPMQLGATSRNRGAVTYCPLQGGILLSQPTLARVIPKLGECETSYRSPDVSFNLAECLRHAANSTCSSYTKHAGERNYSFFELDAFIFDRDIPRVKEEPRFNASFSIFPVPDAKTIYKLHRHYCGVELEAARREIERSRVEVAKIVQFMPGPDTGVTWPIGVPEPYRPKDRFDIIRWEFFNDTQIFFHEDFSNVKNLTGADAEDIREVIELSVRRLQQLHGKELRYAGILNGYRRFDPTRGMEYIVDLLLENDSGKRLPKRVLMVKPLGEIEVIPAPRTSDAQPLTLVLPVTSEETEVSVGNFLDEYAHACIEKGEKTHLFVVFVDSDPKTQKTFSVLKSILAFYQKKYAKTSKINWTEVRTKLSYVPDHVIADALQPHLKPSDLVVMVSPGMELAPEYFKRVRMNVVQGWQVFFPMGFWQYKPNLIYDSKPYPTDLPISSKVGHYDSLDTGHGAFFLSDYQAAKAACPRDQLATADVYRVFLLQGKLHVLRAVEPGLKHRFQQLSCPPSLPQHARHRCLERRARGLATRSQLARLMFQLEEKRRNSTTAAGP